MAHGYCQFKQLFFTERRRTIIDAIFPQKIDSLKEIYRFLFGVPVQSSNKGRLLFFYVRPYKYCVEFFQKNVQSISKLNINAFLFLEKLLKKKYSIHYCHSIYLFCHSISDMNALICEKERQVDKAQSN